MGRQRKKSALEPHVLRYLEGELKTHQARRKHVAWLEECIAWERPGWNAPADRNAGGGRPGGTVSNPTAGRAIILDRELTDARTRVQRIEGALELLTEGERKTVALLYLERRFTPAGAAIHMGYSLSHIYRLKDEALLQIAVTLGLAGNPEPATRPKDVKKERSAAPE